jgi:hypothetical protein
MKYRILEDFNNIEDELYYPQVKKYGIWWYITVSRGIHFYNENVNVLRFTDRYKAEEYIKMHRKYIKPIIHNIDEIE